MQANQMNIEIAVKGKWFKVPALEVDGKNIIVRGKWIRTARVEAEEWLETELGEPQSCAQILKESAEFRADILSFAQKLPATRPRYRYPMEWDSIAAVRLTTFKEWWESLPQ